MDNSDQKIKVYYLSLREDTPKNGFWDYGLLADLLRDLDSVEVSFLPNDDCGVVVIPARSHGGLVNEINREISNLNSVLLMLMGDEESVFPVEKIKHKNIKIWIQNPHPGRHDSYKKLGTGYPPDIHELGNDIPAKTLKWFFAGQVTHSRRLECSTQLKNLDDGLLLESKGFTQGLPHSEYFKAMASAKICPCPSGPQTPDSFRLFEALELGCVPIADTQTPRENWDGFWEWLFDEPVPFPTIINWESLPGYINDCADKFPKLNNKIQSWWLRYKTKLRKQIVFDLEELSGEKISDNITVVIPVSPIKSHPETRILEQTIESVRTNLPNSEIIITFDGVRPEQEQMRVNYNEHIRRILWKCRFWGNTTPIIFDGHIHQNGMMKEIIDRISTPLILYAEQDTPLVTDEPIEWEMLQSKILDGTSNVIRLYHEGVIPKEHESLMIGNDGEKLIRTYQWSQRPHLASLAL